MMTEPEDRTTKYIRDNLVSVVIDAPAGKLTEEISQYRVGAFSNIVFLPRNPSRRLLKLARRALKRKQRIRTFANQHRGKYVHSHKGRPLRRHPIKVLDYAPLRIAGSHHRRP